MSRQAAFAHFGVTLKNPRWSWSGRTEDGKTVVLQLWKDHFASWKPIVYAEKVEPAQSDWIHRPGNKERIENIVWAMEHCGGHFRTVIGVAEDPKADPRKTKSVFPQTALTMKITSFDSATGEFTATAVDT